MSNPIPPNESPQKPELQNERETLHQSGGVHIDANNIQVGADMVARDKIESAGGHIVLAEPGATVIIGERPPFPLSRHHRQKHLTALDALSPSWLLIAAVCATLAVVTGGWFWNIINILFKWTFYLGGSGNEPYGIAAFVWGTTLALMVSLFAFIAGYRYISRSWQSLRESLGVIALYTIFGGLGAVLFYDSGVRQSAESANLGYGGQEVIIAAVWALILSTSTYLPVLILARISKSRVNVLNARYLSLQIPLSTILVCLAIFASLFIGRPTAEIVQLRGFFAGVALRLGLFLGLLLSIVLKLLLSQDRASSGSEQE